MKKVKCICRDCGEVMEIEMGDRPVEVTCRNCGFKGVVRPPDPVGSSPSPREAPVLAPTAPPAPVQASVPAEQIQEVPPPIPASESTPSTPLDQMELPPEGEPSKGEDEAPLPAIPAEAEGEAPPVVPEEAEVVEEEAEAEVEDVSQAMAGEVSVPDLPKAAEVASKPEPQPIIPPSLEPEPQKPVEVEAPPQLGVMLTEKDGRIERLKLDVDKYSQIAEEHSQKAGLLRDELNRTKAELEQAEGSFKVAQVEIEKLTKKATEDFAVAEERACLRLRELEAENADVRKQRDETHSKLCAILADGTFAASVKLQDTRAELEEAKLRLNRTEEALAEARRVRSAAEGQTEQMAFALAKTEEELAKFKNLPQKVAASKAPAVTTPSSQGVPPAKKKKSWWRN